MEKLELKYLGTDFWARPVYEDKDGIILKDTNCDSGDLSLCTVSGGFDGEPNMPISKLKRYQGLEIVILGRENEPTPKEKFNYQMLGRLKSDCDYFLGNGNRSEKYLWGTDVASQIVEMKKLYNSFSDDKKPEWLTYEDILNYENLMTA